MTLAVRKKWLHWASIWIKIMNSDFTQDKIPTVNTIRKRSILEFPLWDQRCLWSARTQVRSQPSTVGYGSGIAATTV